ncbi:MAG TPA: hypothetical protein VN442_18430, partial [Bryobacteraceae bacterium]|nr:hypothetical protein [Bryobacteraceae bacterium]
PGADEEQEGAADKAAVAAAAAGVAKTSGGGAGKDTPPAEKTAVKTGNGATVDGGRHITVDELRAAALSEADGLKLRRKPGTVGSEGARRAERCLALSEIAGELDRGRDAIAAALRAARPAVQAEAVQRLMSVRVRDMHRVAVPLPEKLVTQVEEILHGVYAFGVGQVKSERARQAAGQEPAGAAEIRLATLPLKKKKREPLGVYADGVVSEFINAVTSRAANVALDWMRRPGDLTKGEVIQRVTEELDGQSDKWIDGAAAKGANEAFADGRSDGYEEHRDEIQAVVYSALLDISTCENCAAADGAEGATPDDIPGAPNPDCDGGDRCRCVHVYVFGDEVRN